jgi:uncharacterized membrane protein YphA (DoxX/SURF4 family)
MFLTLLKFNGAFRIAFELLGFGALRTAGVKPGRSSAYYTDSIFFSFFVLQLENSTPLTSLLFLALLMMVLFGFKAKMASFALMLLLLLENVFFNAFWFYSPQSSVFDFKLYVFRVFLCISAITVAAFRYSTPDLGVVQILTRTRRPFFAHSQLRLLPDHVGHWRSAHGGGAWPRWY